jgi:hypothetical protein
LDLGLDHETEMTQALPSYKPPAERRGRELEGGIIIIGGTREPTKEELETPPPAEEA